MVKSRWQAMVRAPALFITYSRFIGLGGRNEYTGEEGRKEFSYCLSFLLFLFSGDVYTGVGGLEEVLRIYDRFENFNESFRQGESNKHLCACCLC